MALLGPRDRPTSQGRRRGKPLMNEINVTPFVDVMLVLLVIFMVTAPLLTAGVDVDLPETQSDPIAGADEPLVVSVDASGQVFIQETAVELPNLAAQLQAVSGANPDARIFVRGDKTIDYGQVMTVVGAIHAAGYRRVALITEPLPESATTPSPGAS